MRVVYVRIFVYIHIYIIWKVVLRVGLVKCYNRKRETKKSTLVPKVERNKKKRRKDVERKMYGTK